MDAPVQVERLWIRRLRWRMRGAWQWPAFAVLTLVDALLITRLPFYEEGPGMWALAELIEPLLPTRPMPKGRAAGRGWGGSRTQELV